MRLALSFVAAAVALMAQSQLPRPELPPEVRALAAIERGVVEELGALPNYTCAQTVRRTRLSAKAQEKLRKRLARRRGDVEAELPLGALDTLNLEVAVIEGRELYAWPGGAFEEKPLAAMIGYGASTTGNYASHLKSLFQNRQGRVEFAGEEMLDGRRVLRYDYVVSLFRSGYAVSTTYGSAEIGYEGSFWADAETLDLLRLEVRGVDLPPRLGLDALTNVIEYQQVDLEGRSFTLLRAAELVLEFRDGQRDINRSELENCRRFRASSELSFGMEEPPVIETALEKTEVTLEAGTELPIALVTPIDSETSKTGDVIEARLTRAIKHDGATMLPKDARVLGRLRQLMRRGGEGGDGYYSVAVEFTEAHGESVVARFAALLVRMAPMEGVSRSLLRRSPDVQTRRDSHLGGHTVTVQAEQDLPRPTTGFQTFYADRARFRLGEGYRMVWRVR